QRSCDDLHCAGKARGGCQNKSEMLGTDPAARGDTGDQCIWRWVIDLEHKDGVVGIIGVTELAQEIFFERAHTAGTRRHREEFPLLQPPARILASETGEDGIDRMDANFD